MRERNLKKGGKIRRQSTINIIRQKERNKINLNLLNYLKKVFICTVIMVKMMNNFFLNSYVVCVVAHIVLYKTTTCT